MKTLFKSFFTLFFFLAFAFLNLSKAQINLNQQQPEWNSEVLETKQMKRYYDLTAKREGEHLTNKDWARWQAWEEITTNNSKAAKTANWENFGPDTVSGRIISIAFHPTDSNTMYVGAASGGLWKTTDYGQTWQPLTDDYPSLAIGAIGIHPQNPNTLLIATGEGYNFGGEFTFGTGILISTDAGATWNTTSVTADISQGFAGMDIIWNTNDPNKVCVATSFGMYFSDDGGYNYTYTLAKMPSRMIADPQHPDTIYLAARYYNSTYPGGFFHSYDAGETWIEVINSGLPTPTNMGYTSLTIHPIYNNIIYASVAKSAVNGLGPLEGLYKSNNYGKTFSYVNANTDFLCYHPPYQNICQGWFANTILVMPEDTNLLFAGGTRMWKSTDGGVSWANCDTIPSGGAYAVHPDHHQTLIHPITGKLFDCNDGGVNYTGNNGENWTSIADGLITHQFYTIAVSQTNSDVIIGGTQDVGTFSTTSAHSSGIWNNDFSGDAFGEAIDHTDENIWYTTNYINFQRMKTTNAGGSWAQINNGTSGADQWRMQIVIDPSDNNSLLSSNNNNMYKTIDQGVSWQTVSNYGPIGTFEYSPVLPSIVYASELFAGSLYKSIDGGDNWTQLSNSPSTPITDIAADPWSTDKVYVSIGSFTANNQVFKSENGGTSWTNISSNLPNIPVNSLVVDPFDNQNIYAGTDLGVWVTENGGNTWQEYNNGLPYVVVEDLHYYKTDSSIRIGTYGRGYWKSKAIEPTIPVNTSNYLAKENSISIYPNPAQKNDELFLAVNVLKDSDLVIGVFDTFGKLISTKNFGSFLKGNHKIPLSKYLQEVDAGIYFIEASLGVQKEKLKLIVTH